MNSDQIITANRIVASITKHMEEMQAIYDDIENNKEAANDEELPELELPELEAVLSNLENARDGLAGLTGADGPA